MLANGIDLKPITEKLTPKDATEHMPPLSCCCHKLLFESGRLLDEKIKTAEIHGRLCKRYTYIHITYIHGVGACDPAS